MTCLFNLNHLASNMPLSLSRFPDHPSRSKLRGIHLKIKSVPVHLTVHDQNDMDILAKEGTSVLRKHKILRMTSEALDQDGLLAQEDLVVLLCSSRRIIRRDIKDCKDVFEGYEYTDIERKTGHSGFLTQISLRIFKIDQTLPSREG